MCIVQNLINEVRVLVQQLIFNLAFHVLHKGWHLVGSKQHQHPRTIMDSESLTTQTTEVSTQSWSPRKWCSPPSSWDVCSSQSLHSDLKKDESLFGQTPCSTVASRKYAHPWKYTHPHLSWSYCKGSLITWKYAHPTICSSMHNNEIRSVHVCVG